VWKFQRILREGESELRIQGWTDTVQEKIRGILWLEKKIACSQKKHEDALAMGNL
jgi:hypothetical protein